MKVNQLYTLVNDATKAVLGETAVLEEDLSNVVDVGKEIVNTDNVDNYVKNLVNHIGKVVFQDRIYAGGVPSVLMDSWEYGSIMEKISADMPKAEENATWQLEDGTDYSPDTFYQPSVSAKFFNSKVTFEIPLSFTERQVKESFSSASQLNGFISMLSTSVENSMTVKLDALIMRTLANMAAETLADEGVDVSPETTGVKAVNLLTLYNEATSNTLAVENAMTDADFIRFATYQISMYRSRMSRVSTLFNVEGKERFTPADLQMTVLLADFAKASETFLASQAYNAERVALPNHDAVPYWQGSGESYAFEDVSKIAVKTSKGGKSVEMSGVLGVIADRNALGVSNLDRRVTTNYNPRAEFYTNFYKFDAGYYNDLSENFAVFFIGESAGAG